MTNRQTTGSAADVHDPENYAQRRGGQTRTSPAGAEHTTGGASTVLDVEPGLRAANRQATRLSPERKPATSGEYNPGGGEYAVENPQGSAGTEVATGSGATGHGGKRRTSNHPPNADPAG